MPPPNTTTGFFTTQSWAQTAAQVNIDWLAEPPEPPPLGTVTGGPQAPVGASPFSMTQVELDTAIQNLASRKYKKPSSVQQWAQPHPELLQDRVHFSGLKLQKTQTIAFEKANKDFIPDDFNWYTTNALVGIEIEVENIRNSVPLEAYWSAKPDNSLRNHGIEFVSNPLQVKQISRALAHAYKAMTVANTPDFSNRTSIHIHLNCRDMSLDQIFVICLLYTIFEKHFYAFAGTKRMNSIFCVPIYRSNILEKLPQVVYNLDGSQWHKYCGLNIAPLLNGYGTVEFRHLYGTADQTRIKQWINQILALRKAALEIPKDQLIEMIKDMNTTSSYMSLYSSVFTADDRVLQEKKDFEESVSLIKQCLFGNEYANNLSKDSDSTYWKFVRHNGLRG